VDGSRDACYARARESDSDDANQSHRCLVVSCCRYDALPPNSMDSTDIAQLFSGHPPYSWLVHAMHIIAHESEG
jgi:hypothetical protein